MSKRFGSKDRRRASGGGGGGGTTTEAESGNESDAVAGKKTTKERAKRMVKKLKVRSKEISVTVHVLSRVNATLHSTVSVGR